MKIGIDAQTTVGQPTGFGFYVQNLTDTLLKIDQKNKYLLFYPKGKRDLSTPARLWRDQATIPFEALRKGVNVLHHPCFSVPIITPMPVVVTVHDLIANFFGEDIPFYSRLFFARWMPFSYRWATRIIAISSHTRADVMRVLNIPAEKIRVIPLAAGAHYRPIKDKAEIARVRARYKIAPDYLLHVGTLSPRKNLEFLVRVFRTLAPQYPSLQLVLTGKKGWYYQGLFHLVRKEGLTKRVIFTQYVDEADKPALYSGARIFAFPSLYEGFGLPPLEAMACGTSVVASNTSSVPEVVGDAGILLSPHSEKEWITTLSHLLNNGREREVLRARGLKRAQLFSWEKTAQQTIEVYEEAAQLKR